jgi:hypothetical protein
MQRPAAGLRPAAVRKPVAGSRPSAMQRPAAGSRPAAVQRPAAGLSPYGAEAGCGVEASCSAEAGSRVDASCGEEASCRVEASCGADERPEYRISWPKLVVVLKGQTLPLSPFQNHAALHGSFGRLQYKYCTLPTKDMASPFTASCIRISWMDS